MTRRLRQTHRVMARELDETRPGNGFGLERVTLDCGHVREQVIPIRHDRPRRASQWLACAACDRPESTAPRTDVHRPSAIIPSDYEWVAFECIRIDGMGDVAAQLENRRMIEAHRARTGGRYSDHEHGGNCGVCGSANAIYTVLFWHRPTNTYVRMGQDCARKCDMAVDESRFTRFRTSIESAREALAGKRKAHAVLSDAGLLDAWAIYTADGGDVRYEESLVRDIVGKLIRYGDISDKQLAFVRSLLGKIANRAAVDAQRAAERAAAMPWTPGRQLITGTVLAVKSVQGYTYDSTTVKMMIKTEDGRRMWSTVPSLFLDGHALRGATVTFKATVEISKDDPTMAFGSRPTPVSITPATPAAACTEIQ